MEKKRFLFLGNSHTYFNDMPELFRRMCYEGGVCSAQIDMLARPYATYEDHLKEETNLRFALVYGGYDYLVMQQAAHTPCPSEAETLRDGGEIIRLARAQGVVPLQCVSWAEKAKPERQAEVNGVCRRLAAQTGTELVPVGQVFFAARDRADIPDLYWRDGEHNSPWGAYAAGATLYATLFRRSPEGLPPMSLTFSKTGHARGQEDWIPVSYPLESVACQALQALVWECVQKEALWNYSM